MNGVATAPVCPRCRGPVVARAERSVPCPRCGAALKLDHRGWWD